MKLQEYRAQVVRPSRIEKAEDYALLPESRDHRLCAWDL